MGLRQRHGACPNLPKVNKGNRHPSDTWTAGCVALAHPKPFFAAPPSSEAPQTHRLKAGNYHLTSKTGKIHKDFLGEMWFLRFQEVLGVLRDAVYNMMQPRLSGSGVPPKELKLYRSTRHSGRGMVIPISSMDTKHPPHGARDKLCPIRRETNS